jgi:hypothetical protein
LVIPVLTIRLKGVGVKKAEKDALTVKCGFDAITNRIFSVEIRHGGTSGNLFEQPRRIRPLAVAGDRQVAVAKMTTAGPIENCVVTIEPGKAVNVAFLMTDDAIPALRIQIFDADTDAMLYASPKDIPVRLGV